MENKFLTFLVSIMAVTILILVIKPSKVTVLGNDNRDINIA